MNGRRINFPVSISFVVERDKKTGQPFMAERMTFEDLISFCIWTCIAGWRAATFRGSVTTAASGFGDWCIRHGVLSAGSTGRDHPHLPSGRCPQERETEERQGICPP